MFSVDMAVNQLPDDTHSALKQCFRVGVNRDHQAIIINSKSFTYQLNLL